MKKKIIISFIVIFLIIFVLFGFIKIKNKRDYDHEVLQNQIVQNQIELSEREANYIPYHKPFSKPAYAILITDDDFYNLNKAEYIFSKILSEF